MKNFPQDIFAPNRRDFVKGAAAVLLGAALPLRAATREVVVVTSYPDEVVSRFEAAFAAAYPQYRLKIIWRMPRDAMPYLLTPGQPTVDAYWSASPRTFARLKQAGVLRKFKLARADLPKKIGNTQLRDDNGYFVATEMAGYGFVINAQALSQLGVPTPMDWRDLTDARLAGRIALPNPAHIGFAPVLIDIVLQNLGWQRGWALWNEIAGQANLMEHGATFVTDDIASGRCAIGLTIDFFARSAIANGAPLQFVYPKHTGINPGHIALMSAAPNPTGAQAFADFVLSDTGQKLLTHADIRKLPVAPSAYAELSADYFRPFEAAQHGALDYDNDAGRDRLGVVAALFDKCLAYRHDDQVAIWQQIRARENAGHNTSQLREVMCTLPLDEEDAANTTLQKQFRDRVEGSAADKNEREVRWQAHTDNRIQLATQWLTDHQA